MRQEQYSGLEDDGGYLRRMCTITANADIDARQAPGERVIEVGRRGVGEAGGTGSLVVTVNVDVPILTVAS